MGNYVTKRQRRKGLKTYCLRRSMSSDHIYTIQQRAPPWECAVVADISPATSVERSIYSDKFLSSPCLSEAEYYVKSESKGDTLVLKRLPKVTRIEYDRSKTEYDHNILRQKPAENGLSGTGRRSKRFAVYDSDSDSSPVYDFIPEDQENTTKEASDRDSTVKHVYSETKSDTLAEKSSAIDESEETELTDPYQRSETISEPDYRAYTNQELVEPSKPNKGHLWSRDKNMYARVKGKTQTRTSTHLERPENIHGERHDDNTSFKEDGLYFVATGANSRSTSVSSRTTASGELLVPRLNYLKKSRDSGIQSWNNTPRVSEISSIGSISKEEKSDVSPQELQLRQIESDNCYNNSNLPLKSDNDTDTDGDTEEIVLPVHTGIGYVPARAEDTNITGNKCATREPVTMNHEEISLRNEKPTMKIKGLTYKNIRTNPPDTNTEISPTQDQTPEVENFCMVKITSLGGNIYSPDLELSGSFPEDFIIENEVNLQFRRMQAQHYEMPPFWKLISDVYHFLPHGTEFRKNVMIRFPFDANQADNFEYDGEYIKQTRVIYSNTGPQARPEWMLVGSKELKQLRDDINVIITDTEVCLFLKRFCLFGVVQAMVPTQDAQVLLHAKYHPKMCVLKIVVELRNETSDAQDYPIGGKLCERESLRLVSDISMVSIILSEIPQGWSLQTTPRKQDLEASYLFRGKSRKATFVLRHDNGLVKDEDSFVTLKVDIDHDKKTELYIAEELLELGTETSQSLPAPIPQTSMTCPSGHQKLCATASAPTMMSPRNKTRSLKQGQSMLGCLASYGCHFPLNNFHQFLDHQNCVEKECCSEDMSRHGEQDNEYMRLKQMSPCELASAQEQHLGPKGKTEGISAQMNQVSLSSNPDVRSKQVELPHNQVPADCTKHVQHDVPQHDFQKQWLVRSDGLKPSVCHDTPQEGCKGGLTFNMFNCHFNADKASPGQCMIAQPAKLSSKTKVKLCQMLVTRLDGKDWRALTDELDIGGYVNQISQSNEDPTARVLQYWETINNHKGTKEYLIKSLKAIGRDDVVPFVEDDSCSSA